eukprot:INCI18100.2.p1 GENE.INCI18100.2~~INCI18100.2.p1  ORF type:complete len:6348 (+),score=1055.95 INCI18100.2:2120-19045(+)
MSATAERLTYTRSALLQLVATGAVRVVTDLEPSALNVPLVALDESAKTRPAKYAWTVRVGQRVLIPRQRPNKKNKHHIYPTEAAAAVAAARASEAEAKFRQKPPLVYGTVRAVEPGLDGEGVIHVSWDAGYRPPPLLSSGAAPNRRFPRASVIVDDGFVHSVPADWGRPQRLLPVLPLGTRVAVVKTASTVGRIQCVIHKLAIITASGPPLQPDMVAVVAAKGVCSHESCSASHNCESANGNLHHGPEMSANLEQPSSNRQGSNGHDANSDTVIVHCTEVIVLAYPAGPFAGGRVTAVERASVDPKAPGGMDCGHGLLESKRGTVVSDNSSAATVHWDGDADDLLETIEKANASRQLRDSFLSFARFVDLQGWPKWQLESHAGLATDRWRVNDIDNEGRLVVVPATAASGRGSANELVLPIALPRPRLRSASGHEILFDTMLVDNAEFGLPLIDQQSAGDLGDAYVTKHDGKGWRMRRSKLQLVYEIVPGWQFQRRRCALFARVQDAWECVLLESARRNSQQFQRRVFAAMREVRVLTLQAEWSELVRRVPSAQARIANAFRLAVSAEKQLRAVLHLPQLRMPRYHPSILGEGIGRFGKRRVGQSSFTRALFAERDDMSNKRLRDHLGFQKRFFAAAEQLRFQHATCLLEHIHTSVKRVQDEMQALEAKAAAQTEAFLLDMQTTRNLTKSARVVVAENRSLLTLATAVSGSQSSFKSNHEAEEHFPGDGEMPLASLDEVASRAETLRDVASLPDSDRHLDPKIDPVVASMVQALVHAHSRIQEFDAIFEAAMPPPRIAMRQGFTTFGAELNKLTICSQRSLAAASVFLRLPQQRNAERFQAWETNFSRRSRLLMQLQVAIGEISDQFLNLVDCQQQQILSATFLRNSPSASSPLPTAENGATETVDACLQNIDDAVKSVQLEFDALQHAVEQHLLSEENNWASSSTSQARLSVDGSVDIKTSPAISMSRAIHDRIQLAEREISQAHLAVQAANSLVERKQTHATVLSLWTSSVVQALSNSHGATVADVQNSLEAILARVWANPYGLARIPHVSQLLAQIQNELAGLHTWGHNFAACVPQAADTLLDQLAASVARFCEIKRHVQVSARLVAAEDEALNFAVRFESAKRLECQAYLQPIGRLLDRVLERVGQQTQARKDDTAPDSLPALLPSVPVLKKLADGSMEALLSLKQELATQTDLRVLASGENLNRHIDFLFDRVSVLAIDVIALDQCCAVANGVQALTTAGVKVPTGPNTVGPIADFAFRWQWKVRLQSCLQHVNSVEASLQAGSDGLCDTLENCFAIQEYLEALRMNISDCIAECTPHKGANTQYQRICRCTGGVLARCQLDRCELTLASAPPPFSRARKSAKKFVKTYKKQKVNECRKLGRSGAKQDTEALHGDDASPQDYTGRIVSAFLVAPKAAGAHSESSSQDTCTTDRRSNASASVETSISPLKLAERLEEVRPDSSAMQQRFENVARYADNCPRIITLQKGLRSLHAQVFVVDQSFREMMEVVSSYGISLHFHQLPLLESKLSSVFGTIYRLAEDFHVTIMSDDAVEKQLTALTSAIGQLRQLESDVRDAVSAEKARRDRLSDSAALNLQKAVRGFLARVRVRRLIFERVVEEQREREARAAVHVQLLARMRRARIHSLATQTRCIQMEESIASSDEVARAAGRHVRPRWVRRCEPHAMRLYYQHKVTNRVTFTAPKDFKQPWHRFAAWRRAIFVSNEHFSSVSRAQSPYDEQDEVSARSSTASPVLKQSHVTESISLGLALPRQVPVIREIFFDVWTGDVSCEQPPEFIERFSCASPGGVLHCWSLQWQQDKHRPMYVLLAELEAQPSSLPSRVAAAISGGTELVCLDEPGGFVPLLASIGTAVEFVCLLESGMHYWHRGFVTKVYSDGSVDHADVALEFDVQLEPRAKQHVNHLFTSGQTVHRVHGSFLRQLFAPGMFVRVIASSWGFGANFGLVESVDSDYDNNGALYNVRIGEKTFRLRGNQLRATHSGENGITAGMRCRYFSEGTWKTGDVVQCDGEDGFMSFERKRHSREEKDQEDQSNAWRDSVLSVDEAGDQPTEVICHASAVHRYFDIGEAVDVFRPDIGAWLVGRVLNFAQSGVYVVELTGTDDMDMRRGEQRKRWLRDVPHNLVRRHVALGHSATAKALSLTIPPVVSAEASQFDGPLPDSRILCDGFRVRFVRELAQSLGLEFPLGGLVVNCRYDGTYDVLTISEDDQRLDRDERRIVSGVARHNLAPLFRAGDRVKYITEVVELGTACDLLLSTKAWVEGIVTCIHDNNGKRRYSIGPAVADTMPAARVAASLELAKLSATLIIQRDDSQLWPLVNGVPCELHAFYEHEVVNVCTIGNDGQELWSLSRRATVVQVMPVECAGGAVAVLLNQQSGRLCAIDVSFLQIHYSRGRPVWLLDGSNHWQPGVIADNDASDDSAFRVQAVPMNETTTNTVDGVAVNDVSSLLVEKVPLAQAKDRLRPRFPPGCLVKAWNSLLGCWQTVEVLSLQEENQYDATHVSQYVDVFARSSRTLAVPREHIRAMPQGELDELMYFHAAHLQAVDMHSRSAGSTRRALLEQTLRCGANPNVTCRLDRARIASGADYAQEVDDGLASAVAAIVSGSFTALHVAASEGLVEAVRCLLQYKADFKVKNNAGLTPMHLAAMNGHAKCVRLLLKCVPLRDEKYTVVNSVTWVGETPLFYAVQQGFLEVVEILINADADVNISRSDGCTPLMIAVSEGFEDIVDLLLALPSTHVLFVSDSGWTAQTLSKGKPSLEKKLEAAVARSLGDNSNHASQNALMVAQRQPCQHLQNGWNVAVCLSGDYDSAASVWEEALVISADPLGNFEVELCVRSGNVASSAGLSSPCFVPRDFLFSSNTLRRHLVPGDLSHVHILLHPGEVVRCNPNNELQIPAGGNTGMDRDVSTLGSGGSNIRSWLTAVVLGVRPRRQVQAPNNPTLNFALPFYDVAVTDGKHRGVVIQDVPGTAWNIHPLHDGASSNLGANTLEVCIDGASMWVPCGLDDPAASALFESAAPSQKRRTFASGDHVTVFSKNRSEDRGVVVGRTRTLKGTGSADCVDVLVGEISPIVSFAGFGSKQLAVRDRRLRSVPRNSLFHSRPRFANGMVVACSLENTGSQSGITSPLGSPRSATQPALDTGDTLFVVDHVYPELEAYELVGVSDRALRRRAHADDLKMFIRRGDQVLAFIGESWVLCIVARTATPTHLRASASVVELYPMRDRGRSDLRDVDVDTATVYVPAGLISPVLSVPEVGVAMQITPDGLRMAKNLIGDDKFIDKTTTGFYVEGIERSDFVSELAVRLSALPSVSFCPHGRVLLEADSNCGTIVAFSVLGHSFTGIILRTRVESKAVGVDPHTMLDVLIVDSSSGVPTSQVPPLWSDACPTESVFDDGEELDIILDESTGSPMLAALLPDYNNKAPIVLAGPHCAWGLARGIHTDFVWPCVPALELGQAVFHVAAHRPATVEGFVDADTGIRSDADTTNRAGGIVQIKYFADPVDTVSAVAAPNHVAESSLVSDDPMMEQQSVLASALVPFFPTGMAVVAFDKTRYRWVAGTVFARPNLDPRAVHILTVDAGATSSDDPVMLNMHAALVRPFPSNRRLFYPGARVVQPDVGADGMTGDIMVMPSAFKDAEWSVNRLMAEYSPDVLVGQISDGSGYAVVDSVEFKVEQTSFGQNAQQVMPLGTEVRFLDSSLSMKPSDLLKAKSTGSGLALKRGLAISGARDCATIVDASGTKHSRVPYGFAFPEMQPVSLFAYVWVPDVRVRKGPDGAVQEAEWVVVEVQAILHEPVANGGTQLVVAKVQTEPRDEGPQHDASSQWRVSQWFAEQYFVDNEKVFFFDIQATAWKVGFVRESLFLGAEDQPTTATGAGVYCVILCRDGQLYTVLNKAVRRFCLAQVAVGDKVLAYSDTVVQGKAKCDAGVVVDVLSKNLNDFLDPSLSVIVEFPIYEHSESTNSADSFAHDTTAQSADFERREVRLSHLLPIFEPMSWVVMLVFDQTANRHFYSNALVTAQNDGGNGYTQAIVCDSFAAAGRSTTVLTESLEQRKFSLDLYAQVNFPAHLLSENLGIACTTEPSRVGTVVAFSDCADAVDLHCTLVGEAHPSNGNEPGFCVLEGVPVVNLTPVFEVGELVDVFRASDKEWAQGFVVRSKRCAPDADGLAFDIVTFEDIVFEAIPAHLVRLRIPNVYEFDRVVFDAGQGDWRSGYVEQVHQYCCEVIVPKKESGTDNAALDILTPHFQTLILALDVGDAVSVFDPDFCAASNPDDSRKNISSAVVNGVVVSVSDGSFPHAMRVDVLTLDGRLLKNVSWRSLCKRYFAFEAGDVVEALCKQTDETSDLPLTEQRENAFYWRPGTVVRADDDTQLYDVRMVGGTSGAGQLVTGIACSRMRIAIEVGARVRMVSNDLRGHCFGLVAVKTSVTSVDTRYTLIVEDDSIVHEIPHGFLEYSEHQQSFVAGQTVEALYVDESLYSVGKVVSVADGNAAAYTVRLQVADSGSESEASNEPTTVDVKVRGENLRKYFDVGWHVNMFSSVRSAFSVCVVLEKHERASAKRSHEYVYLCMELETGALLAECVPELMRNGFPGTSPEENESEKTLLQAVKDEDIDCIVRLYAAKADLNQIVDDQGRSCLHYAVHLNKLRFIRVLTGLGVDVSARDDAGFTALHRAVFLQGNAALQGLVAGAKDRQTAGAGLAVDVLDSQSSVGATSVFVAAQENNISALRVLLEAKCSANSQTSAGITPLYIALQEQHTEVVDALLSCPGIDVNSQTEDGYTPLTVALQQPNSSGVVERLLNLKADVNPYKNRSADADSMAKARTPLQIAVFMSDFKLVRLLLAAGAEPTAASASSDGSLTEVMWAAFRGDVDILHLFLQHGVDVEDETPDGESVGKLVKRIYKCSVDSMLAISPADIEVEVAPEESRAVFDDIDSDKNGRLSVDELKQYMRQRTGLPKLYGADFDKLAMVEFFRFSSAASLASSSQARAAALEAKQSVESGSGTSRKDAHTADLDFDAFHGSFKRFKKLANLPQVLARIRRRESLLIEPGWLVMTHADSATFSDEVTGLVLRVFAVGAGGNEVATPQLKGKAPAGQIADVSQLRFDVLDVDTGELVQNATVDDFAFFDSNNQATEGVFVTSKQGQTGQQDPRKFVKRMCDTSELFALQQTFVGLDPNTILDGAPLLHHVIAHCDDDAVEAAVKCMLRVGADPLLRAPGTGLHALAEAVKTRETMDAAEALTSYCRERAEEEASATGRGPKSGVSHHQVLLDLLNQFDDETRCNLAVLEAVRRGSEDWLSFLLSAGCQLSREDAAEALGKPGTFGDSQQPTYVHEAVRAGQSETAVELIDISKSLSKAIDNEGRSTVHAAVLGGDLDLLEALCDKGVNVSTTDRNGRSPLRDAVSVLNVDAVDILLRHNAKISETGAEIRTALLLGAVSMYQMFRNKLEEARGAEGLQFLDRILDQHKLNEVSMRVFGCSVRALDDVDVNRAVKDFSPAGDDKIQMLFQSFAGEMRNVKNESVISEKMLITFIRSSFIAELYGSHLDRFVECIVERPTTFESSETLQDGSIPDGIMMNIAEFGMLYQHMEEIVAVKLITKNMQHPPGAGGAAAVDGDTGSESERETDKE